MPLSLQQSRSPCTPQKWERELHPRPPCRERTICALCSPRPKAEIVYYALCSRRKKAESIGGTVAHLLAARGAAQAKQEVFLEVIIDSLRVAASGEVQAKQDFFCTVVDSHLNAGRRALTRWSGLLFKATTSIFLRVTDDQHRVASC